MVVGWMYDIASRGGHTSIGWLTNQACWEVLTSRRGGLIPLPVLVVDVAMVTMEAPPTSTGVQIAAVASPHTDGELFSQCRSGYLRVNWSSSDIVGGGRGGGAVVVTERVPCSGC